MIKNYDEKFEWLIKYQGYKCSACGEDVKNYWKDDYDNKYRI